ncbi:hypothetical protein ACES2J_07705 [Bdellovibrio bacteriovorus]|uniref:hypothetical protein n=1 Tax=Bdellovibrio bacteriovorus TaxID=959 RepID=UPI0035A5C0DA
MGNKLVLGTMRLHERTQDVGAWVQFFIEAHRLGVRKLHSSSEYESYPLLKEILCYLKKNHPEIEFEHIVKLAEPSFNDAGYESGRLTEKVNDYLLDLQTSRLAVIQWMWRLSLKEDELRIQNFLEASSGLSSEVSELKSGSKIEQVMCFPYSVSFANTAIQQNFIDGLVVYRNVLETEYDESLKAATRLGKESYIIRPLAAGKALSEAGKPARELYNWALDHEGVVGAIVSISKPHHLRDLASNS